MTESYYETASYELKCVQRGCEALTEFLKDGCELFFERSLDPEIDRLGYCRLLDDAQETLTLDKTLYGLLLKLGEYGKEMER